MKVLLLNPRSTNLYEINNKCYSPLGLLYLAASLKQANHTVDIVDAEALNLTNKEAIQRIKDYSAELVGIPLLSDTLYLVWLFVKQLLAVIPETKILLGGIHATACPDDVLRQFEGVNYLLSGEAEQSIVEFCDALEHGKDLAEVAGLSYRREEEIIHNPPVPIREQLDELPLPARELLSDEYARGKYYTILHGRPTDSILTSRGCVYRCGFCYNMKASYRVRSPENIMGEILTIYGRGIRDIEVCEDNFLEYRDRAVDLFELIIKEGIKITLFIKGRVDCVDEGLLRLAKRAGVNHISYGMESGVQLILDAMGKRTTVSQNQRAAEITRRAGIKYNAGWIVGYPGDTPESFAETTRFIKKIKPDTVSMRVLSPYPHTAVYQRAKRDGSLMGDWDVSGPGAPWIKLEWVRSRRDLELMVNNSLRSIYFTPFYAASFSRELLRTFNPRLGRYMVQQVIKTLAGKMKGF